MAAPLKISLKEIESITNNFANANLIGEELLGKLYKGQLLVSEELMEIVVRRLDRSSHLQEIAFEKEILVLSRLNHKNIVSNIGFSYENNEMLIINKRVAHGSLSSHLSGPKLTWMTRLRISVGVAHALSYLHNGVERNSSVIHNNINSGTILLDENWEAKISGFEFSMTIPERNLDRAYEKLGIAFYKSDVFSIGVVLFELLCGREAFISKEDNSFQAPLAIFHYENRTLFKLVDPQLFSQMDHLSFLIFSEIAYICLKEQGSSPKMDLVRKRLEKALEVQQMYEDNAYEPLTVAVERTLPDHLKLKLKSLEHMRIPFVDILSVTEKFASKYCIASGGFGSVYTAELEHVDKSYCLAIEGESEGEIPKKRSQVAIKRIINIGDEIAERGFYAEIEMLTSCRHSNIIPLLGFCDEGSAMILIYEYASNRSLCDYLHDAGRLHNDSWKQRVKLCLDVAKGLIFLHTPQGDRKEIVHRDIKSANILLDENFEAKVGDFGLSIFLSAGEKQSTKSTPGTWVYQDPQYRMDAKLRKESDVYSFGVVLFEVLCGSLAYAPKYTGKNKGLALVAREHSNNETITEMIDPRIKEKAIETVLTSIKGAGQKSLHTFSTIAYRCLAEAQVDRPTIKDVVKALEDALIFEEIREDRYQVSFKDLQLATDNFSDKNLFSSADQNWKAYEGKVSRNGHTTIIDVRRYGSEGKKIYDFREELKILMEHKHENVIGLLGYCKEGEEQIIVYEKTLHGTLYHRVCEASLTWEKRLQISIDIASGLDFLHGGSLGRHVVIHRNIKSRNILLDVDMKAKISNFGFALVHPVDEEPQVKKILGTRAYMDPDYLNNRRLSKESDIYSFGILLFLILLRRHAVEIKDGSSRSIKGYYEEGTLSDMVFEGANEHIAPLSVAIFRRIAIQCLHYKKKQRPSAGEMIIQLKQALEIQEKGINIPKVPFVDIKSATDNFSNEKRIGRGGFREVFKGELPRANGLKIVAAKRMNRSSSGDADFYRELEILLKFKHKNVIGLEGYCEEMGEKIIVCEYASEGSLDHWLDNISLTWMKRLKICIDVANGLDFLHGGVLRKEVVLHRDIKSSNILLSSDWRAKISDFRISLISPFNLELYHLFKIPTGTQGYIDPTHIEMIPFSKASDIYAFGVVLFELLCGRLAHPTGTSPEQSLGPLAKKYYEQNKLGELVFEGIKDQILQLSLSTFADIAYNCLHHDRDERPTASGIVVELKKALEFQEDCEMWEPKLPTDYKEIIQQSRTPEICVTEKKKYIYDMLFEGILIQKGKVWFWLDSFNKRNEMISATLFTYKGQSSQKWKRIRKSRFERVLMVMDISNLQIQTQIKPQFLTPNVMYGVYLIFKLAEPNKRSSEPTYVDLKYKKENQTLHAYFATRRDDGWMMIELYRFLNDKDDHGDFEVLLEGFSRYYCRNHHSIYVEGIEFRAIDHVTHEKMGKLKDVPQTMRSTLNTGQLIQPSEVNRKGEHILSAKEVLYDSSNVQLFNLKPSEQSRHGEVIQVLSQQALNIKCKIENQKLLADTHYRCYMVFKLSEKCRGLYCPVKVRNLLHRNDKETKALYFRYPNEWNIHDINQVPAQRDGGWMEVNVWEFNSKDELRNGCIHMDLKLVSYEGTMSGLIVGGFEFQPV